MKDYDFDVFLSHNKADQAAVERLASQLEKSGLKVWLDHWNLLPGDPWQDEIEEALDRSRTVAVFVGPSGIGGWHNEEMRSALETRVVDRNRRVIPVLLPGAVEPELPRFLRRLHWVDFRNGLEDEATFNLFVAGITGRPLKRSEPSSATPTLPPRIRTYREFDLRLARTGDDKLEVEIISPHSGEGRGIAPIPAYTTASIESGQDASLQQIGEEIGQALFPEEVRRRFETSLHDATKAGEACACVCAFTAKTWQIFLEKQRASKKIISRCDPPHRWCATFQPQNHPANFRYAAQFTCSASSAAHLIKRHSRWTKRKSD